MYRLRKLVSLLTLSVVALGGFTGNASAAIFDSFSDPNPQGPVSSTGALAQNTTSGLSGIMFTDTRMIDITSTGNQSNIRVNQGGSGRVSISNDENLGSVSHVTYNFGSSLNYSGVGSITINDAFQDGAAGGNPTIALKFTNSSNVSDTTLAQLVPSITGDLIFSLAGLNASVLNDVTQFQVIINTPASPSQIIGGAGTDMSFGPIEFPGNPPFINQPVPEPFTLATFGALSLVGGIAARRKLKAKTVA